MGLSLHDRLDKVASIYEGLYQKFYRKSNPDFKIRLNPPVRDIELATVERELNRLLPEEAHLLYKWHNGVFGSYLVPDLAFNTLSMAHEFAKVSHPVGLYLLTNEGGGCVEPTALFPIFNIDRALFYVLTTFVERKKISPVYFSLTDDLPEITMISYSIEGLVELWQASLEKRLTKINSHGVFWEKDIYGFDPLMIPFGKE